MSFRRAQTEGLVRTGGTAGVTRSSPPADEIPELLTITSPIEIRLTRSTRECIRNDLWSTTSRDGCEAGGFLLARSFRSWDRRIEILGATRTYDAVRTSTSVRLDPEGWLGAEVAVEKEGRDEVVAGSWHSEPGHNPEPSNSDLRSWLSMFDVCAKWRYDSAAHVGLIFTAGREPAWVKPEVSAWIVRRDEWGSPVCQPARIL